MKNAELKLLKIKQGNRHAADNVAEFRSFSSETIWNDEALLAIFEQRLIEEIQLMLLSVVPCLYLNASDSLP